MTPHAPLSPSHWLGIDIGGTKIAVIVLNQDNQMMGQALLPTETTTPAHLVNGVIAAADHALTQAHLNLNQIAGVGIGIPGQVNTHTGEVTLAVNLNLSNYPLGQELSQRWGKPVILENDVRAAAVGAYFHLTQYSALNTQSSLAYLSIGTGIAAGVVLDGRLHRGANGLAGEVGHITINPQGERCACGQMGCLETIVAGPGIVRQARQAGLAVTHAGEVYAAASQGHPQAQAIVQRVSAALGQAIQWLVLTYDVEKVILGGGVTRAGAAFLDPILQNIAQRRATSSLLQLLLPEGKIALLPPGFNAGVWGAIALARQHLARGE
jgi:glucokinase